MSLTYVIGVLGSVGGFLIAQIVGLYTFARTLETTKSIEMIHLTRELAQEFYAGEEEKVVYRPVKTAIESCEAIYRSNGGKFNHDDINTYLGFFDDLGFYLDQGAVNLDVLDQEFGAYIIEAFEYPELRRYVSDLEKNAKQQDAFAMFVALATKLEGLPLRRELAKSWRSGAACKQMKATISN